MTLMLSGCFLYGGGSVHTFTKDSAFTDSMPLFTIGAGHDIDDNLNVYIQHKSQPFEDDGYGLNEAGFILRTGDL